MEQVTITIGSETLIKILMNRLDELGQSEHKELFEKMYRTQLETGAFDEDIDADIELIVDRDVEQYEVVCKDKYPIEFEQLLKDSKNDIFDIVVNNDKTKILIKY